MAAPVSCWSPSVRSGVDVLLAVVSHLLVPARSAGDWVTRRPEVLILPVIGALLGWAGAWPAAALVAGAVVLLVMVMVVVAVSWT